MQETGKSVKMIYFLISGLFTLSASLIWGINTLFLMKAGLDIMQVFLVNAVYTASMAVFEIPTGIFADTLGRKMSFITSTIILILGTLGYLTGYFMKDSISVFIFMSVILGLAFTFYSGAVEAWLVDALAKVGDQEGVDNIFAKGGVISSVATLIGTISGGLLGNIDLSIPYILRSLILISVTLIGIYKMRDIGFQTRQLNLKKIPEEMAKLAKVSFKYGFGHPSMKIIMGMTFLQSSFMMWGWYAWQPYFLELFGDKDAVWLAGIISAIISVAMAGGNYFVTKIMNIAKKRTTILMLSYIFQALCLIIVGLTDNFYVAVSMFVTFLFLLSLAMPVKQSYLHKLIPADQRATLISFDSLIGSGGGTIGQTGLGYVAKTFAISIGYIIGGITYALIVPFIWMLRRQKDDGDRIIK